MREKEMARSGAGGAVPLPCCGGAVPGAEGPRGTLLRVKLPLLCGRSRPLPPPLLLAVLCVLPLWPEWAGCGAPPPPDACARASEAQAPRERGQTDSGACSSKRRPGEALTW